MQDVEQAHDLADPSTHHRERGPRLALVAPAFELEEGKRDGGQHDMMRPPVKAAPFEVIKPEVVFQFTISCAART